MEVSEVCVCVLCVSCVSVLSSTRICFRSERSSSEPSSAACWPDLKTKLQHLCRTWTHSWTPLTTRSDTHICDHTCWSKHQLDDLILSLFLYSFSSDSACLLTEALSLIYSVWNCALLDLWTSSRYRCCLKFVRASRQLWLLHSRQPWMVVWHHVSIC